MEENVINVCRSFVLCNDFIPPTSSEDYKWRYLSWGYFDGIHVSDNLFKKDNKVDLEKLDNFYREESAKLNGSYSEQIIYGIRTEMVEERMDGQVTDSDFWDNEENQKKFPFIFITLIQADKNINELSIAWNEQFNFEENLNINENYKAISYLSLDNSDMILVIRSKKYSEGAKVIDEIHRNTEFYLNKCFGWKTKYTFTVASASKNYVYNISENNENKEVVDTANIYLIEKEIGSVDRVFEEIKRVLLNAGLSNDQIKEKKSVLGYNDEVIELNNVPWNVFLKLYCIGDEGVLNHTHPIYKSSLNGATTIIGLKQSVITNDHNMVQIRDSEQNIEISQSDTDQNNGLNHKNICQNKFLCPIMHAKCANMLKNTSEKLSIQNLKRSIYQIINSLQKFEKTPFSDYLFLPTALPLNMALDMARELDIDEHEYMRKLVGEEELLGYFYDFIKGLNMYVQNSNRSDRQFIQIPEFNIRVYDIPTKITAFYNAYMFNLKNYLNKMVKYEEGEVAHEYEFLLCPGAANDLHIKEFFKKVSDTRRLFLVESPESILFNPVIMLIVLTHELGHVVGTGIRMREKRTEYAIIIMCKITCNYMKAGIMQATKKSEGIHSFDTNYGEIWPYINEERFWEKLEKSLYEDLKEYLKEGKALKDRLYNDNGEKNENYEYTKKFRDPRKDHSCVVEAELAEGITEILEKKNDSLWGYFLEKDYAYWLGKNPNEAISKKAELRGDIHQLIADMRNFHSIWNRTNAFNLGQSIRVVYNLFQECLADLVCILTLELTIKEYLNTILWNAEYLYGKPKPGNEIHLRCCLVTFCMQYPSEEIGGNSQKIYRWTDDDLRKLMDDDKCFNFMKGIKKTLEIFLGDDEVRKKDYIRDIQSALGMLYDSFIIEKIVAYLLTCIREFFMYNSKKQMQDEQKELQRVFRQFQKNNVKELAISMQVYVENHLNILKEKHDKVIKDEGGIYGESIRC